MTRRSKKTACVEVPDVYTWALKGATYDAARPHGGTLVQGAQADDAARADPSSYARSA